jgi:hypothetical protein
LNKGSNCSTLVWAWEGGAICQCLVSEPAVDSIRLFGCHPAELAKLNGSIRFAGISVVSFHTIHVNSRVYLNHTDSPVGEGTEGSGFKVVHEFTSGFSQDI